MQRGKAQAIGRIQTIRLVLTPRHDMTGKQQARLCQAGHAAFPSVTAQHCLAEELLFDALLDYHLPRFADVVGSQVIFDRQGCSTSAGNQPRLQVFAL
ncbi:hypothetical protein D3C84_423660 [compost metagenome]